jgi:hypothetical protein
MKSKSFLTLALAAVLFAAAIGSETIGSDLLGVGDDGWYKWRVEGTEELEIYAEIEDGRPTELMIASFDCGKRHYPDAQDLGVVAAGESIHWLRRFVDPWSDVSNELLFAIAAHDDDEAFDYIDHLLMAED